MHTILALTVSRAYDRVKMNTCFPEGFSVVSPTLQSTRVASLWLELAHMLAIL